MRKLLAAALLLTLPLAAGCTSDPANTPTPGATTAPTGANTVTVANMSFSPATITIKVNDTVTWANNDSVPHTVTADDHSFDSGSVASGRSYTRTFDKAGTYPYHCNLHPHMKGTVVVE